MSNNPEIVTLTPEQAGNFQTLQEALKKVGGDHSRIKVSNPLAVYSEPLFKDALTPKTVLIDSNKSSEENWRSITEQTTQHQREVIIREKTGTPPGQPIDPIRLKHVFNPIEDRLAKAIALTELAIAEGDDPANPASATVGAAAAIKLSDLKEALGTVRELIAVGGDTPTLPERVQKLDTLLAAEA